MKIVPASQKKAQMVQSLGDKFILDVLGIDGALWTDETYISDFTFFSYDIRKAVREGSKQGLFVFQYRVYIGPPGLALKRDRKNKNNWEIREVEAEAKDVRGDIIRKAEDVFGVNITEVYDKYLTDIIMYIISNLSAASLDLLYKGMN